MPPPPRRRRAAVRLAALLLGAVGALAVGGARAGRAEDAVRAQAAEPVPTADPAPPSAAAAAAGEAAYTYAIGVFRPEYTAPPPGSYSLPPIATVSDHALLDVDGRATRLFTLTGDRVTVVAFIYTTCTEAQGCPVSLAVLHAIDRALATDPALAGHTRLATISFDPERDTPARMAAVRRLHQPRSDWRFATTRDATALAPLLADFDQPVAKLLDEHGRWTGLFRHVLKVFLVDPQHRIRNVYSTAFLNPALVLNDVRTLLLETPRPARVRPAS